LIVPAPFNNFYKGRKILITGHTGFKGSWLSIWLNKLGADVIGYALPPPTQPSLFDICKLKEKLTSIEGDVRDYKLLKDIFEKYQPEIVFHMAAQSLVRASYIQPLETYETNVMGTVNVLEVCRHASSVKAIVNVTSDKCYENREWIWGYRENDPMGGYDPYSSSKGCAELVTNAYINSYFSADTDKEQAKYLASVRAGNIIGGGDWAKDRLIPDCVRASMSNKPIIIRYPDAVRPWQHVLEPIYGYLLLARRLYEDGPAFSGAWNFGPDDCNIKPVRWIVQYMTEHWGNGLSWQVDDGNNPHESWYLKLDCSKAKTKLGWYPQWDLRLALNKTIEWYNAYLNNQDTYHLCINQIENYELSVKNHTV
jgi:CDP-glucose 4,6-dehydratase